MHKCFRTWIARLSAAAPVTAILCAAALAGCGGTGGAGTIRVGPNEETKLPSAAIAAAASGDKILIDPGEYFDCAVVKADALTIEGAGPGVVLTDKTCQGKALLVTTGRDITIRNLTLTRARVPDGNGAGIRAEGANLTVDHVRFINNENGILAAANPRSTIRIVNSAFESNGKCEQACAHGIYANTVALLRVEGSRFFNQRVGHHIKSRALRTELVGNEIKDGPDGTASYLVDVSNGGAVLIENNTMQKGPNASNRSAAVAIGLEGVTNPTRSIIVRNNRFTNDLSTETIFVRNVTAEEAQLTGNTIRGKVVPLQGDGSVK